MGNCCSSVYGAIVDSEFRDKLAEVKRRRGSQADAPPSQEGQTAEAEALLEVMKPSPEDQAASVSQLQQLRACSSPDEARKKAISNYQAARSNLDMVFKSLLKDNKQCSFEEVDMGGQKGVWMTPELVVGKRVMMYIHGGGMVWGDFRSQGTIGMGPRLARALKSRSLFVEYRLLPEHNTADAIDDCVNAYKWLLAQGHPNTNIVIAGESSGGFLTLWTMLKIRDLGLPRPAAVIALSPDTDVTLSGSTARGHDDICRYEEMELAAYVISDFGRINPRDLSPLFQPLHDLPPLMIQVGGLEVSLDDSVRFAKAARAAGNEVNLQVWAQMYHAWQMFEDWHAEGRMALQQIAEWVNSTLGIAA